MDKKVIVSFTSFPAAIGCVPDVVNSILSGTVLPDKIVLYVTLSQFENNQLPSWLVEFEKKNPLFEVRDYPRDIRSYRKLIPALIDFPNDLIITIDDDVAYHKNLIKRLLEVHRENPDCVIAHRAKIIRKDKPYKKWKKLRWYHFLFRKKRVGFDIMQTGVGGVLYPPGVMDEKMLSPDLFTSIAPTTDDIWFWAATVAKGNKVMAVPFGYNKPKGLPKPKAASLKLYNFKSGIDRNKAALDAIIEKYPIIEERIKK